MKVEGRVMGSPSENLLKHSFGGTYSNELLAEGGLYSERPEPFSYISVEVRFVFPSVICVESAIRMITLQICSQAISEVACRIYQSCPCWKKTKKALRT